MSTARATGRRVARRVVGMVVAAALVALAAGCSRAWPIPLDVRPWLEEGAFASTPVAVPQPDPSTHWTLLAGGDVLMDRTEPAGVDPFAGIEPALASGDIALINAEMAISDRGTPVGKVFDFRAPASAAQRIADAGVDVANLANNHARDYGPVALMDSVGLLEGAGVVALGAGADDTEAYRYRILEAGEAATVAFVGVSLIVPRGFSAGPGYPGIATGEELDRVYESVRAGAEEADVVIATVHWGVERATCPTDRQREVAQGLLDAGADAVIGHHPHVLQPVEFIDGKLVAYSLGNFIWHPRVLISAHTGVLQIDFDADRIIGWTFHPHFFDENGAPVPIHSGERYDTIRQIIGGNCEPYTMLPAR